MSEKIQGEIEIYQVYYFFFTYQELRRMGYAEAQMRLDNSKYSIVFGLISQLQKQPKINQNQQ